MSDHDQNEHDQNEHGQNEHEPLEPDHDDAVTGALRAALSGRAGTATISADAWERVEARRDDGGRRRFGAFGAAMPMLAVAAAAVLLIVAGALLRPPGALEMTVPATIPPGSSTTAPVATALPPGTSPAPEPITTVTTAAPVPGTMRTAVLRNASYPKALCPWTNETPTGTVPFTDGEGGDPALPPGEFGPGMRMKLATVPDGIAYGDLDGDGAEEAAVVVECLPLFGGDYVKASVAVMTLRAGQVVPLTILSEAGVQHRPLVPTVTDDRSPVTMAPGAPMDYTVADGVAVRDGQLVVSWSQNTMGSATYRTTASYRIAGAQAQWVSDTGPELEGGQQFIDEALQKYAIRTTDLRSMNIWFSTTHLCNPVFGAPPQSPDFRPDVTLVDGTATVTGPGIPPGSSIAIEDVRYGEVTGDLGLEDAVVRMRCTNGTETMSEIWMVGLSPVSTEPGAPLRPLLFGTLFRQDEPAATALDVRVEGSVIIVQWRSLAPGPGGVPIEWEGRYPMR